MSAARPGRLAGYPDLSAGAGVDVSDVRPGLLDKLEQIAQAIRQRVTIISGYRTPKHSVAVGGFADDPHTRGIAVDATVNGTPIARVRGGRRAIAAHGLVSGDQAGFDPNKPGGFDPAHVQLPSGGSSRSAPRPTGLSYSFSQLEKLWIANGGPRAAAPVAAAIALAESGGVAGSLNDDASTHDYSVGLWQINYYGNLWNERTRAFGPPSALYDANANARAAVALYRGSGFAAWSTYKNGDYQQYLNGATPSSSPSPSRNRPTSAGDGGSGSGGGWSSIIGASESTLTGALGPAGGLVGLFAGASSVADVLKAALWLVEPRNWLRMVEFVTGGLLMLFGAVGLGVIFAARTPTGQAVTTAASALPGPAGLAGRIGSFAGRPGQAARRETRDLVRARTTPSPEQRRGAIRARTRELELDRQARDEERRKVRAAAGEQRIRRRAANFDEVPF